jgi:shikimate kinase
VTKLLIGHRGVGKSSLLKRLIGYFPENQFFDLDFEIEKNQALNIVDIFSKNGEISFRKTEREVLIKLVTAHPQSWISLGAGVELDSLVGLSVEIIWVRRKTDSLGRIFLDRPRLNPELSPELEYQKRYLEREENYRKHASWIYDLPEGLNDISTAEKDIFQNKINEPTGSISLSKINSRTVDRVKDWNLKYFEMRDDGCPSEEIQKSWEILEKNISKDKLLYSYRKHRVPFANLSEGLPKNCDWPVELGDCSSGCSILSLHDRQPHESISAVVSRLEQSSAPNQHLKLAVEVRSFSELQHVVQWQAKDPENRSVLPRSENGRWSWVRLWLKGRQRINFIRESEGSAPDQPTWYEWLSSPMKPAGFAAILGDPVFHSWSPAFHQKYFAEKGIPFWAINIMEEEWDEALVVLEGMGLRAAAVTSPLKTRAGGNTLWKEDGKWLQQNTDPDGLRALASKIPDFQKQSVMVWGGGGTLPALRKIFPQAAYYSQRSGKPRNSGAIGASEFDVLIWAADPRGALPPAEIKASCVLDLNYREDSRAREFALSAKAQYYSGQIMFEAQALEQQRLWQRIKI